MTKKGSCSRGKICVVARVYGNNDDVVCCWSCLVVTIFSMLGLRRIEEESEENIRE